MPSTQSLHRGIFQEVQRQMKEKGIDLKVPAVRMRIRRGTDPLAMEIYADILQKRIVDHAHAAEKLSKVTKKLEEVS